MHGKYEDKLKGRLQYNELVTAYWETISERYFEDGELAIEDVQDALDLSHAFAAKNDDGEASIPVDGLRILTMYFRGEIKKKSGRPSRSLTQDMRILGAQTIFQKHIKDGKTAKEAVFLVSDWMGISESAATDWIYRVTPRKNTPIHRLAERAATLASEQHRKTPHDDSKDADG
jgi:hypothetical protein